MSSSLHTNCSPDGHEVKDFFANRSVLVTGATGFLGKMMIEKLLRSCDKIKRIYIIIRTQANMDPKQRMSEMLNTKVFNRLLKERPDAVSKMYAIAGDVALPAMGLSEEDQAKLVKDVSIVFHLAATVRFDEPLKKALRINVGGTRNVIDLCHKISGLKALVHVSTAYSHCQRKEICEEFYPSFVHPIQLMEVIESMDDDLVDAFTHNLLAGRPSTYCLSKAMAEQLLVEEASDMPVAVVRPSIVSMTWKEPFPGWTESYFGPNGIVVAYSKGLLRCMLYHSELKVDFVPVDVVTNLTIAVSWYTAMHKPHDTLIYNCTSSADNKLTWKQNWDYGCKIQEQQPIRSIWYPSMQSFRNRLLFHLYFYLTMLYPGCLLDAIAWATRRKPVFVKTQKKILKMATTMSYYFTREWHFSNDNVWMLWKAMDPLSQKEFYFDFREIYWPSYFADSHRGIKHFLLKEDLSKIEDDLKHTRKLRVFHHLCQLAIIFMLWLFLKMFCWPLLYEG